MGAPRFRIVASASAKLVTTAKRARSGSPWRSAKRFKNAFEPSRRAAAFGRTERGDAGLAERIDDAPAQRRLGADDDEIDLSLAARPPRSIAARSAMRTPRTADVLSDGRSFVPPLPGATNTRVTSGERARARARACSRAPEPTTSADLLIALGRYHGEPRAATRASPSVLRASTMSERASWDAYFMRIAADVATRSTCDRKHVGAVLVRDKCILATGYNGSIRGLPALRRGGHMMQDGHTACERSTRRRTPSSKRRGMASASKARPST